MIFDLSKTKSIANTFIAEMRDENIQKDPMRFRKNLERLGEFFAYEISKTLNYVSKEVTTPLGLSQCDVLGQQPVLATILRAGLPMQQGVLNVFDQDDCCFISAYRKVNKQGDVCIQMDYGSTHDLDVKVVIMEGQSVE